MVDPLLRLEVTMALSDADEVSWSTFPVVESLLIQQMKIQAPAVGQRQGGAGKGDDLDDRRADTTGPPSGQWK